jgi:Lyase, N terminal.
MNSRIAVILLVCHILLAAPGVAQDYFEVINPAILSFEESPKPFSGDNHSQLSVSDEHFKHQTHALRWIWKEKNAKISIHQPIPYLSKNPNPNEASISTFIFGSMPNNLSTAS